MNTKVYEGKLISGKEALIALANGEEVEVNQSGHWSSCDHVKALQVERIIEDYYQFRLKPRTIKLNGIEVPASAGDKDCHHQGIWILNSLELKEYSYVVLDVADEPPRYWWSTEEEVKQVVAALHQVFGGSHDN